MSNLVSTIIFSYLLGAIPSALWISKIFYKKDIREFGSKNSGLTNIFRVLGIKAAVPVAVVDLGKGMLAAYLGLSASQSAMLPTNFAMVCGLVSILGHSFTCFGAFRGGKGVLTALGVFLLLLPFSALGSFALWGIVLWWSGYVSLASICAALAIATLAGLEMLSERTTPLVAGLTLGLAAFVIYRHRSNLIRLKNGTENRFKTRSQFK